MGFSWMRIQSGLLERGNDTSCRCREKEIVSPLTVLNVCGVRSRNKIPEFVSGTPGMLTIGAARNEIPIRNRRERIAMSLYGIVSPPRIVGKSKPMLEIMDLVKKVAPSSISVMIIGESGTGKELIARAVHCCSRRARGPFVTVNCAALPESLVESEFFGHERGAFSGAVARKIGKFEHANGGTIFLDEIGDMPLQIQVKTLRVLQEQELERVGGSGAVKIDTRVVSATNKDPERGVREGYFREDLLYRLKGITIRMPSLRERRDDIPVLIRFFMEKYGRETLNGVCRISANALDALMGYSFPGNVRELEHIIQRGVVLAEGDEITLRELPESVTGCGEANDPSAGLHVDQAELMNALKGITIRNNGNTPKFWYKTLRCTTVDAIFKFLLDTNGREFSRAEFTNFLCRNSKNARNKYGTAGDYLPLLKDRGILVRNDAKANKVRFKLDNTFLSVGENA